MRVWEMYAAVLDRRESNKRFYVFGNVQDVHAETLQKRG